MTSAKKIAENEDLLSEILLRLPVRSLVRFKCVSKPWLLLISSSHFCRTHSSRNFRSLSVSGFLFRDSNSFGFVGFDGARLELARPLAFMEKSNVAIIHSCNGLVLCSSMTFNGSGLLNDYFVFNPTTTKISSIPPSPFEGLRNPLVSVLNLIFYPSRSPDFRIFFASGAIKGRFEIFYTRLFLYSSNSRSWSPIESPQVESKPSYGNVVFYNGSLYWLLDGYQSLLRFDVDTQCFNTITIKGDSDPRARCSEMYPYLGQCNGKLYVVGEAYFSSTGLVVFELGEDCSTLLFKYNVELIHVVEDVDESYSYEDYHLIIFGVVGGEDEDDLQLLVMLSNSEVILYSIKEKTATIMPNVNFLGNPHPYIESFSPVI